MSVADLTDEQKRMLVVLAGQSPDYLLAPAAAAVQAAELSPQAAAAALAVLAEHGYAREEEIVGLRDVLDEQGQPTGATEESDVIDSGWVITGKGKKAAG